MSATRLPKLPQPVRGTDPRAAIRVRTSIQAGSGNRLFDSQNQHYLNADESFDV